MGDVGSVVHAQPDAHDEQHRGGRVHGQAPEVHEPHHVDQGEDDAEEDQDGSRDVGEHEDDDEEDADEGKDDAPVKLHRQDPVHLPELVSEEQNVDHNCFPSALSSYLSDLANELPSISASPFNIIITSLPFRSGEGSSLQAGLRHQLLHLLHGWHVLSWAWWQVDSVCFFTSVLTNQKREPKEL